MPGENIFNPGMILSTGLMGDKFEGGDQKCKEEGGGDVRDSLIKGVIVVLMWTYRCP